MLMHLFKSLWITQKLDVLSKGIFMTGKNVGKIIKIWSSLFLTEILLNWSCLSGVYAVTANSFTCFAVKFRAWETQARSIFLGQKRGKTSKICSPLLLSLTALAGYGNHLLLSLGLRKLASDSPLVVGAAFQTDYHQRMKTKYVRL